MGLGVEVVVPSANEEQIYVIGILRWLRALVNAGVGGRELLEDLVVGADGKKKVGGVRFAYLGWRGSEPRYPSGLWEVLRDWQCKGMEAEYRFYPKREYGKMQM